MTSAGNKWQRPSSVPVPSVWATVEGKKPLKNGKVPRFRIQDITPELEDAAVEHMCTHFMRDEPYCAILGAENDLEAKREVGGIWKNVLQHRIGLVALLDNAEELGDPLLPKIAGCNMTLPMFPDEEDPQLVNPKMRSIINFVCMASHSVDCFKKYNVDVIMYALGLCVDPAYRGQGLGEEILKARFVMGKAVGIPLTSTVFTGSASQALARKAGFELLAELKPDVYKEDGKTVFQGVNSKSIQYMAARIEL